jgi:glutamate synthase (NADPH/NADH) small chain
VLEANRCLYCYDAPCTAACPTGIDVAAFIRKIATGNLKGSSRTILRSNWIALTCAKACPVDILCEGACVYAARGEVPIAIGRLQRYSIDRYFRDGMPALFAPAPANGRSVGIVGAGPAGLSCGAELALLGYDVTIYEGRKLPGGLDTWGIAPYKMSYHDSLNEVRLIESLGVKILTGVWIGRDIRLHELDRRHDAIFLGVGLGTAADLGIPGEELGGVVEALEFIEKVTTRKWSSVNVGDNVAVIGAGNTAMDAATAAKRLGARQVMVIYRRTEEEMPAYEYEYDLAKNDGVAFHFLTAPVRILSSREHAETLECVRMRLGPADESGRRAPEPVPGSEFRLPVDMVIKATGQDATVEFLSFIPGLRLEHGTLVVNPETLQTTNPRYFAGGDCTNGGMSVVNAAADGKRAALGIDRYISNKRRE